jgi:guanylate kinase
LSVAPEPEPPGGCRLTVLAGPTAVGKGTVSAYLRDHYPHVWISVSMTTRKPRPGEVDGVHYRFVDDATFERTIADGGFLEWAVVHSGARYGTPVEPLRRALAEGRPTLMEIDLQGARQVRRLIPDALFVFLAPPSWEELVRRLVDRGSEDPVEQARRLDTARVELAAAAASEPEFDVTIVNREVPQAAEELVTLMQSPCASRRSMS